MRPDYCPIGNEPCQSLCDEPCSTQNKEMKLFAAPLPVQPERQWVGLRDIEIASAFEGTPQSFRDKEIFTKAIEAKLKEKNA